MTTDKYQLLLQAYAMRDHFALMIFGLALLLLFTDWQLTSMPRMRTFFRISCLVIWTVAIGTAYLIPNAFAYLLVPGGQL